MLAKTSSFTEDLQQIDKELNNIVSISNFTGMLRPFFVGRGKRIRSLLYLNFWNNSINMNLEKKHITIALIEAIHFASIIHDDVVDNNLCRRNADSFMKKHGRKNSILLGDLVLIRAIDKFLALHYDNKIVANIFLRECESTAYGAALEQKLTIHSTFHEYLRAASLKTSPFFKLACFLGALLSTNDFELAKRAAMYGVSFGVLFQAQNDLNGYKSKTFTESEDYLEKNITLPLIVLRDYLGYNLNNLSTRNQLGYEEIKSLINTDVFRIKTKALLKKFIVAIR